MDITIGDEKIIELVSPLSMQEIHEKAMGRRVDAFGQLVRFVQRPKPEDIELGQVEKRFEPFWYGSARAFYKYDRRHHYDVPVTAEVRAVTLYDHEHSVQPGHTFGMDGLEHCEE